MQGLAETMRVFHCDHCGHLLFFENTQCVRCGQLVAYLPDLAIVGSLDRKSMTRLMTQAGTWRSPLEARGRLLPALQELRSRAGLQLGRPGRRSASALRLVPADARHPGPRRPATPPGVVPPRGRQAPARLHAASARASDRQPRRRSRNEGSRSNSRRMIPTAPRSLTGHATGLITDQHRRGRRCRARAATDVAARAVSHARRALPARERPLLLGPPDRRPRRARGFSRGIRRRAIRLRRGVERPTTLRVPSADWRDRFISAYASAHPLEDWAETWSHYLHMVDTLETAAACGVSLQPRRSGRAVAQPRVALRRRRRCALRSADRQLVPRDLPAEQPQSRPGPG